ncbi:hypothetical protein GCM10012275_25870 [Longimycelium tulufanense]|uniref:Putative restriction endonuclease domain-containing protein n=1 Tax=Longimycelium tulufanense TaxID=907463 RepID=A0A8J3CDT0_9PSEU|nr:Uma2 family endonuclease [Longimycelium tulufanense]GGM53645.1 hypothetical protein GCM10012275_25870 [Longimycelium tulufanense]
MSAAIEHPIGPHTVEDWLAADQPGDGGRLELIWGYWVVSPAPAGRHQFIGDTLRSLLHDAHRSANRRDLYAVTGVGVQINNALRTALIPDVVVLSGPPEEISFPPERVRLVAEIWSPGNSLSERETKISAYAAAGIKYLWTIDQKSLVLSTYYLHEGRYRPAAEARPGQVTRIEAAPVPVEIDTAELAPWA